MTVADRQSHSVSFIVPALNEETVIEQVVREIAATTDGLLSIYEIILVDDGSTDRTGEIMDRLAAELPHMRVIHNRPNVGVGASYRIGLREAKLDYVMMLCGDGGLPASSLPPVIEKIGTADMVVPWMVNLRAIKTPARFAISRLYTYLMNLISGRWLHYYNGLAVHRRTLVQGIPLTSTGLGIHAECIVKLLKSGHSYVEVGIPGAEITHRSSALRLKNVVSVAGTVAALTWELVQFRHGAANQGSSRSC